MRLDRLLTLYLFGPLARRRRPKGEVRIPILMYHSISEQDDSERHPYYQTNTRPDVFARHMQYLADNNYEVISLSTAVSVLSSSSHNTQHLTPTTAAQRLVVLTWDDGYSDFLDNAWPILKKHGFTATMFLPTGFIGNECNALNGKGCLTWGQVRALASNGTSIGAHTVSHRQLYGKDRQTISEEVQGSKREIEEKLGREVNLYSYAYAFPAQDKAFVSMYEMLLHAAGYSAAVSTRIGTAKPGDSPFILKRLPVNSADDVELFSAKLEGAYDWLHTVQAAKKKMRFAG